MIPVLFNILLFLIPLVFFKNTSELFEFNKIIALYIFTLFIFLSWVYKSIVHRKFIFRQTILDIPIGLYLLGLFISTLFSIDPRTSWLGYYSRFNGGLVSQICYAVLYWAFVSNLDKNKAIQSLNSFLLGTLVASILAIFEHFGVFLTCGIMGLGYQNSCWVQDVQTRVFSTLGQPNWLAALLVTLLPLTWRKSYKYYPASLLLFVTLLFTKSRSGFLAFGIESVIFWGLTFWKEKTKSLMEFLGLFLIFGLLTLLIFYKPKTDTVQATAPVVGPALEVGGTESGTIRKYVWIGAFNIFKNYPLLGTGPETFAFAFPEFKPKEHNLTSEWDFIYNKAHNEYLNYLATSGIFGFGTYLSIIICSLFVLFKSKQFDLLSGYVAILVTNFFGFSVVPISLLFFLLPAMAVLQALNIETKFSQKLSKNKIRIVAIIFISLAIFGSLLVIRYWQADIHYNNAKNANRDNDPIKAKDEITKAIQYTPNEPLYIAEQALANKDIDLAAKALDLNPYNQNVRNILISNLNSKAKESQDYLLAAEEIAEIGTTITPLNPKIFYQLAILNLKNNKIDDGLKNLEKAVNLKPNYKEGRFALGLTYIDVKNYEKAKENLEYILKNIDPNDELTKKYLDQAKSASK